MKLSWMRHYLLLFIICMASVSCNKDFAAKFDSLKKDCDNSDKANNKEIPAAKCHAWFPVQTTKETIKEVFIPGERVLVPRETIMVPVSIDCDSLLKAQPKAKNSKNTIYVSVPKYVQVDTQRIVKETEKKDVAELSMWKTRWDAVVKEKEATATECVRLRSLTSKWRGAAIHTWIVIAIIALVLFLLKKFKT